VGVLAGTDTVETDGGEEAETVGEDAETYGLLGGADTVAIDGVETEKTEG